MKAIRGVCGDFCPACGGELPDGEVRCRGCREVVLR